MTDVARSAAVILSQVRLEVLPVTLMFPLLLSHFNVGMSIRSTYNMITIHNAVMFSDKRLLSCTFPCPITLSFVAVGT
jgi:hypothetical protein